MEKVLIVIPAYNEEKRIAKTIHTYHQYFSKLASDTIINFELLIVLNGCRDNTFNIIQNLQQTLHNIHALNLTQAGKGFAVKTGFLEALTNKENTYIGFVDADCATAPEYFYELIQKMKDADGCIASRYIAGSQVYPTRPFVKAWGRKIFFHGLIRLLFGMNYHDYQCGAKVFTYNALNLIAEHMTIGRWAFDVELLYLCKRFNLKVTEVPTVWHDQQDSKLQTLRGGLPMLGALIKLRAHYLPWNKTIKSHSPSV